MFGILLLVYLAHVLLISADGVFNCAITVEDNSDEQVVTCDTGVNHCLTFLSRKSEGHKYVQQGRGCMSWNELVRRCPATPGMCHILHETRDNLNKTCCCQGNMCNNGTLQLATIEYNDGPSSAASENLANFGLLHSLTTNDTTNQTIDVNALSIGALSVFFVILLACLIFVVRYMDATSLGQRLHLLVCSKCKRDGIPCTEKANGQMHPQHSSTTTPLLMYNDASSCQHLAANNDGSFYPLGNHPSYPLCLSDVAKIKSAEKIAMQHIVDNCHKSHLLGRGRFAEVWSASLPTKSIQQAALCFSAALGSCVNTIDDSTSPSDRHDCSTTSATMANSETKAGVIGCIGSGFSVTLGEADEQTMSDPHLFDSDQALRNEDSVLHNNASLTTSGEYHDVAIKAFPARDQRACSAELAIFRALQEPIWHQFLSSTRSKKLFTFDDLLPHSQVAASEPVAHTAAAISSSSGLSSTADNAASNRSASTSCTVSRQTRHANLIQMLAAGVITDDNSEIPRQLESGPLTGYSGTPSRLVREYHLVLEYAAGGSLRSLLTSGQWLSISRILQISRDITRGISFMHSDVSLERSAVRGSLAKVPIAHRDLKPENILLRADGSACLSDFGQAKLVTDAQSEYHQHPVGSGPTNSTHYWSVGVTRPASQSISTGVHIGRSNLECMSQAGTLRYMAPELLDGAINFTGTSLLRTDIYSMGLVLWELLTAVYLPDRPSLTTPGPSNRQTANPQHGTLSDGKWFPTCGEEDEDADLMATASPSATAYLGGNDGVGFLMLTGGWHSDCVPSGLATQHQRHLPSPPPPDNFRHRRHYLPYELELTSAAGGQPTNLLRQLVVVDKYRPMANYLWTFYPVLSQLYRTVTECWDPEPEARLTVDCILERINILTELLKRCVQLNNDQ